MIVNYNEIGIEAFQNKQYEEAAQAFNDAIEANPEEAVGYINFGNLLAVLNDTERAERFFQKAITLDDQAATAYYGLANLYYNNERYSEAATLYQKAIEYQLEGADAFYMLAKCLEHQENYKFALPYMQRAAELAPHDSQIRLSYGILLCTLEMFEQAEPELLAVTAMDKENADAHYNLGVLYAVSTQNTEAALHHLQCALDIAPTFEQAQFIYDLVQQRIQ